MLAARRTGSTAGCSDPCVGATGAMLVRMCDAARNLVTSLHVRIVPLRHKVFVLMDSDSQALTLPGITRLLSDRQEASAPRTRMRMCNVAGGPHTREQAHCMGTQPSNTTTSSSDGRTLR